AGLTRAYVGEVGPRALTAEHRWGVRLPDPGRLHVCVVARGRGPSPDRVHLQRAYLLGMTIDTTLGDVDLEPFRLDRRWRTRPGQRLRMILNPDGRTHPDDVCECDEAEERDAEEQPVVLPEVECHDATRCAVVAGIGAPARGRVKPTSWDNPRW